MRLKKSIILLVFSQCPLIFLIFILPSCGAQVTTAGYQSPSYSSSSSIDSIKCHLKNTRINVSRLPLIVKKRYADEEEEDYDDPNDSQEEDEYQDSDVCSIDQMFSSFGEFYPSENEQSQEPLEPRKPEHLNETMAIIQRLLQIKANISAKMQPKMSRFIPSMMELLLAIDLPSECMASLARIGRAAQEGESWALMCEKNILFLF
jgi:hypothetical protein